MADDLIQFDGGVLVADMLQESTATNEIELTQYPIETGAFISDHAIIKPFTLELTLVQTETPIAAAGFRTQSVDLTYPVRPAATQQGRVDVAQAPAQLTQQGRADVAQAPVQLTLQGLGNAVVSALGGGPAKEIRWTGQKTDAPAGFKTVRWTGQKTDEPAGFKQLKVSVLQADQEVARVNEFHDALLSLQAATTLLVVTVKGQVYIDMVLTSVKRTDPQGKAGCATFGVTLQQIKTVETQTVELPPVPKATSKKGRGVQNPEPVPEETRKKRQALQFVQSFGLLQDTPKP